MGNFPQQYFTRDNVLVRTGPPGERESYTSSSLGRKFAGTVKGVYAGFIPSALGSILTLAIDPTEGLSNFKVDSRDDPAGLDVIVEAPITLDFATSMASDFLPDGLLILARAHYLETGDASAEIIAQTKTTTETVFTVGVAPTVFDLSTISALGAVFPGSLSIGITVDGFGPDTITDDGFGNLTSGASGLPLGGTVNYLTGTLTGVTAPLTALSMVFLTRTRCPSADEVLLCRLTGTPGAIVVNATPPDDRDTPIAFSGCTIPFGFLETGAVEALAAAVLILNEVIAARTDLQGVAHPNLKTRLDTDLAALAMATRLGKVGRVLRSNVYSVPAGAKEINVSGSFSSNDRVHEPKIVLNGLGSETTVGALAAPNDPVRNVCVILETTNRDRLLNNATSRLVVVGRLNQEEDFLLDGVVTFTTALTTVTGDSSAQFLTQIEPGDLIQGADGVFYEVAAISADGQLALTSAYQGAGAGTGGVLRRRIKLQFFTANAGVEDEEELEAAVEIEFFFPAFVDISRGNFDNTVTLLKPGERPPVPTASFTVPGKVENAQPGGFVGSILLRQQGSLVGGGPFHTLNFTAATIIENAPGVLDVLTIGPVGPAGSGGGVGPPGDPGVAGPNIDQIAVFEVSSETALGPAGQILATHTVNFGFDVDFLGGGIARDRDAGSFAPQDQVEIDDIRLDSPQVGTIEALGGPAGPFIDNFVILYLDAAGHNP